MGCQKLLILIESKCKKLSINKSFSRTTNMAQAKHEIKKLGASLVVQWLRIRLPMQGTRVRALVWEDPTCCGATKHVSHNY